MIQILLLSIPIIPSSSSVTTQRVNSFENRNASTIPIRRRFARRFRFSLFPSCSSSPFQLVSIWLEADTLVLFSSSFLPSWVRVTVSIERRCRYVHALRARFLIVRKKEGTDQIRDPVHFARIEDNRAETRNWEACLRPIGRDSLENVANRWLEDVKLLLFLFFFFFAFLYSITRDGWDKIAKRERWYNFCRISTK